MSDIYKVAKISDTHIGPIRFESNMISLLWIAQDAAEQGCSQMHHHGDFFDKTAREEDLWMASRFIAAVDMPLLVLKGNHGTDRGLQTIEGFYTKSGHKVTVVYEPQIIEIAPIKIYCLPHLDKSNIVAARAYTGRIDSQVEFNEAVEAILRYFALDSAQSKGIKTFAGHFNIPGCRVSTGQELNDPGLRQGFNVPLNLLKELHVADVGVGHIHLSQYLCQGPMPIMYIGDHWRKDFGEVEPKGYWIHSYDRHTGKLVSAEFRQNPHAPLLVTEEWWWDGSEWQFQSEDQDITNAEVRVIAKYKQGSNPDRADLENTYKGACLSFRYEPLVVAESVSRAKEISEAVTPEKKLIALWEHKGAPDPVTQAGVLEKLSTLTERA